MNHSSWCEGNWWPASLSLVLIREPRSIHTLYMDGLYIIINTYIISSYKFPLWDLIRTSDMSMPRVFSWSYFTCINILSCRIKRKCMRWSSFFYLALLWMSEASWRAFLCSIFSVWMMLKNDNWIGMYMYVCCIYVYVCLLYMNIYVCMSVVYICVCVCIYI